MPRFLERILFLQEGDVFQTHVPLVRERFAADLPQVVVDFADRPETVRGGDHQAVITPTLPWLPEALERAENCDWVHFLSAGVEKIWDMPVDWSGLTLTKSSGIHGPQMSEYAIGALLHFTKGFDRFIEQSRAREWRRFWLDELTGQTMLVLGGGSIGEMVGKRARAFGMRAISVKRRPEAQDWADHTLDLESARKHLNEVTALVVCVPLTGATRGMVDHTLLSALAPGAVLVDISRGGVVQADAVADLIDSGHLRGAALDVFETQPLSRESRLWNRSNVLLTPHVSGTSPQYLDRALEVFIDNARRWQQGLPMLSQVDQSARY